MTLQPDAYSGPPPDPAWLQGWNDAIHALADGQPLTAPTQTPVQQLATAYRVERLAYQGDQAAHYGGLARELVSAREQLAACRVAVDRLEASLARARDVIGRLDEDVRSWVSRTVDAETAVARAMALHSAERGQHPDFCGHDLLELPCPTIQALEGKP